MSFPIQPSQSPQAQFDFNPSTPPPPPPKPSAHAAEPDAYQAHGGRYSLPLQHESATGHQGGHVASSTGGLYAPNGLIQGPPDGWLPERLRDKSTADLQYLYQDPSLQDALVHSPDTAHPSIAASRSPIESLLTANSSLASSLSALETHLRQQRDTTQSRLLAQRALERQWRGKQAEQDAALKDFSPPALYQQLSAAVAEQEALCRGLEETFLEGGAGREVTAGVGGNGSDESGIATEREVVEFVKRLREARKVAYLRRERKERWDEGRVGGWR